MTDSKTLFARAARTAQRRYDPLPSHRLARQPEHLRWHYALLLAAVVSAQSAVSATQSQLLLMLLEALQLGDIRAALFEETRTLDEATLLEAARLIVEADVAHNLLIDALILLRLDAPLDDDTSQLAVELASLLGLKAHTLSSCARAASAVLGLDGKPSDTQAALNWPATYPRVKKIIIGAAQQRGRR